jgi:hypothetical protein
MPVQEVAADVEPVACIAPDQGHSAEERQIDRSDAREVAVAAELLLEARVRRPPAAAEAE